MQILKLLKGILLAHKQGAASNAVTSFCAWGSWARTMPLTYLVVLLIMTQGSSLLQEGCQSHAQGAAKKVPTFSPVPGIQESFPHDWTPVNPSS